LKRLSGWDAVLLYSETPTVHMHTMKLAVIELDDLKGRTFGIEEFRKVIHSRLYKLEPFRYELVDIPLKFHHPMWRENCEVDLEYHVRPYRVDSPGGRRQLDEAVGRTASTPLDRSKPLWEMYFIEGLTGGRIAVLGKIHHALADGVASANLLAQGMDLQQGPQLDRDSYATDPAPGRAQLMRSAFADHMRQIGRLPGVMRYTAQGIGRVRKSSKKLSPGLTRPFTPPPSFMNHRVDAQRKFATATMALADVKETAKHLGVTINDMVLGISAGALRKLSLKYDGRSDHPLLASVPVSFDFSRDRISGNRFTGVRISRPHPPSGCSIDSQTRTARTRC
jgi:diacylglycerol O-acyltransferase / wax synthase